MEKKWFIFPLHVKIKEEILKFQKMLSLLMEQNVNRIVCEIPWASCFDTLSWRSLCDLQCEPFMAILLTLDLLWHVYLSQGKQLVCLKSKAKRYFSFYGYKILFAWVDSYYLRWIIPSLALFYSSCYDI